MKGNNWTRTLSITSPIDENEEFEPAPLHITVTNINEPEPETESKTDIPRNNTPKRSLPPRKMAPLFKAKLQYKPPKQFVKSPSFKKRFVVIDVQVKSLTGNK